MCSDAAYNVRCADMTDAADAEAYQRAIESQDRMLRPSLSGDAPDRTLSVRWATTATVTVLVATLSEAPATVVGTLEMIGPLEASLAVKAPPVVQHTRLHDRRLTAAKGALLPARE